MTEILQDPPIAMRPGPVAVPCFATCLALATGSLYLSAYTRFGFSVFLPLDNLYLLVCIFSLFYAAARLLDLATTLFARSSVRRSFQELLVALVAAAVQILSFRGIEWFSKVLS